MSVPVQRKWLYALVVSAGVLGLAEWVARGVDAELPGWSANDNPSVVMTGHPTRLWGLAAGERTNVDTVATVDPVGLRGPIPSAPRATDEERVLVLGDCERSSGGSRRGLSSFRILWSAWSDGEPGSRCSGDLRDAVGAPDKGEAPREDMFWG